MDAATTEDSRTASCSTKESYFRRGFCPASEQLRELFHDNIFRLSSNCYLGLALAWRQRLLLAGKRPLHVCRAGSPIDAEADA
jgi:hypothetical protein